MKRILQFMMILALALGQTACEGPEGPEGPPGPDGPPGPTGPAGPSSKAMVFEFQTDFALSQNGNYVINLDLEELAEAGVQVSESDAVMAYMLMGGYLLTDDTPVYYWSPLPQTFFLTEGRVQYNFVHSYLDMIFFIEPSFNLSTLAAAARDELTKEQAFRVVIIPGDYLNGRVAKSRIDLNNYKEVAAHYNLTEEDVKKIELK